ncbi:unnamed protein product [Enterobius vermicularis]|uniref:Uncharacterized protein n=1 Tax=Enterobius vermicularis TaxID=51028 RepID=A0A0N4VFH6_ENTVE|nr:unnamed protein product [Enterobius vermicularis]
MLCLTFSWPDTPPLLKDLYNILDRLGKHNGGQPDLKLFSPRFAPVIPDDSNTRIAYSYISLLMFRRFLSPNILPLYEDDQQQTNLTLPQLLKLFGVPENERSAVLELIMQVSGAEKVITDTLKRMNNYTKASDAERLQLAKRMSELNRKLSNSFTLKQKADIDQRKYTFLSKKQMITVFGEEGPYNISSLPFDVDEYDKWTFVEKKKALFNTIRTMAEWNKPEAEKTTRKKRQITLAPFMFSPPLFRLVILNPVTLSPNIFSPNIFAPLLLTPLILAPQAGSPRVFSPYLLSPFILSPQAISPNVFSPYVLSPNILSPVVLTPIVFSPPVLSPNILNPTLLSGPIFSPLVLSPSIQSRAIWGISLFSPSAFS